MEEGRAFLGQNPDPDALSIRDLARRIGVSPNAPYRHFPTRATLLSAIAVAGFEGISEQLAAAHHEGAEGVGRIWSGLAEKEPGVAALMLARSVDPAVASAARGWLAEVVSAIERVGEEDDPEGVVQRAITCWATVVGVTLLREGGLLAGIDEWLIPDSAQVARLASVRP